MAPYWPDAPPVTVKPRSTGVPMGVDELAVTLKIAFPDPPADSAPKAHVELLIKRNGLVPPGMESVAMTFDTAA